MLACLIRRVFFALKARLGGEGGGREWHQADADIGAAGRHVDFTNSTRLIRALAVALQISCIDLIAGN